MTVQVKRKAGKLQVAYTYVSTEAPDRELSYYAYADTQAGAYALAAKLMRVDDARDDVVRQRLLDIIDEQYKLWQKRTNQI